MTDYLCKPGDTIVWMSDHWECQPSHHFVLALGLILTVLLLLLAFMKRRRKKKSLNTLLEEFMASVSDLQASMDALTTAVNALIARPVGGIDPASLDPVKAAMDSLTSAVNAALGV